jgi:hypothetical protein
MRLAYQRPTQIIFTMRFLFNVLDIALPIKAPLRDAVIILEVNRLQFKKPISRNFQSLHFTKRIITCNNDSECSKWIPVPFNKGESNTEERSHYKMSIVQIK